jgi:hypothetical protein
LAEYLFFYIRDFFLYEHFLSAAMGEFCFLPACLAEENTFVEFHRFAAAER